MILYDDKMLLLLNVNVSNYIICNIHLRPRYYKHKSEYIWIRILIFVIVFFLHEWSFRSHETNESADCETAYFWNCSPKWLFAVHHGNSLVYAFAEVSIEQTMTQDSFNILYANFCPHKATNRFVLNRCLCRFESVWLMPISPMIMSWCLSWSIRFLE